MSGKPWPQWRKELQRRRMLGNAMRRGRTMPENAKAAISASLKDNKRRAAVPHPEPERQQVRMSMYRAHASGRHPWSAPLIERNEAMLEARLRGATYVAIGRRFGVSQHGARKAVTRLMNRKERFDAAAGL